MKGVVLSALLTFALAQPVFAQTREPFRSPVAAAAKSLFVPGWGQWSNGDDTKGTLAVVGAAVGLAFATETIVIWSSERGKDFNRNLGWSVVALTLGLGAIDAYRSADRLNRENGYDLARLRLLDDGRALQLGVVLLQFSFDGP